MGGRCRPQFLAEQTAQQGDQGNADQGDTTASHELFYVFYEKILARNKP